MTRPAATRPGVRFGEVFRYEFAYRLRNPSTWIYAAFLFLMMCWGVAATSDGDDFVKANAPKAMAQGIVLFGGLFGMLVSAALFGDAAIRDVAAGMDPLLYTTRLRKSEYLGGRFLATLVMNAILVLAIPLGFWVATMTIADADAIGPNRLAAYVQPVLLFTWPNLVLIGALQFTIGTLFRQTIPVYIGTAAFFAGYIFAAEQWGYIETPLLSAIADPLGINALLAMTRYWTPADLATRLVGFPPVLVLNRVLWLAIAAGLLVALHQKFRFAHADGIGWIRRRAGVAAATVEGDGAERRWQGTVPRVAGVFDRWTRVHQTAAVARQSLREVISGRGFKAGFAAAIGLTLLWGWNVGDTLFDTSTWPVTHLVVEEVLSRRAPFIPWLVIALYAGELVWKYRETGSAEIVDAAPVRTGIALLGRFLALAAIIVAFQIALLIGGVLLQTFQGYYNYEPWLYIRVLFGFHLADLVLLAALAMTVHVLVNQKYIGHIIVLLASAFRIGGPMMGVHRMLVYDSDPGWRYSDMNGFGPYLEPFLWFKAYWASWALLLAAITILFWIRGTESGVRHRLAQARARFRGPTMRMAGAASVLILAVGGFVFYNTNILNEYVGRDEAALPQVDYERRYKRFENTPQPVITNADLRVEIYPDAPAVDLRGTYQLENRTSVAIDAVHVVIDRDVDTRSIALDRASRVTVIDDETGYRILTLDKPLQPGDSARLSFDTTYRPRGFRGTSAIQTDVVRNGTYVDRRWLPFVGYQPAFELTSDAARKRFGLAPKTALPAADRADARLHDENLRNEDGVRYEMIVGTAADQTAVVSAPLRRTWTENGRRYFHYGSDVASRFGASVFSAKYAVVEDRWRDVELQVFHHPGHPQNPRRMIDVMKASLDHYTNTFGPYQFHQLRIVEIPPYSINGRAMATTIAFAEQNFITRVTEDGGDMMFFGTAHEVAHSWWGGQLRGAFARGRAVLSEALSNYSAMMLTEKLRGAAEARRVYDFQMDRYLSRRSAFERDVPLVEVEDHPHIAYGKGAVAMYTLREQIGADAVNTALRRLLEKHRDSGPPYATAPDLVRELRAVTPESQQYLITDLFETVTLWDVKATHAIARRRDDGHFDVAFDVTAKKMRADSAGRETETPMEEEFVEVGVFGPDTDKGPGELLYLQRHRIRAGTQKIFVTVPREPARAGVDPFRKLIDRVRDDNVVEVNCCVIT
jgi:cation transport regulator ChaB/ABC-type transport system involved in multi-copper enzyme maturation permease subunit